MKYLTNYYIVYKQLKKNYDFSNVIVLIAVVEVTIFGS